MSSTPRAGSGRSVTAILCVWLAAAVGIGLSGLFERVPAPVVGATNLTLVTLTLLALFRVSGLRRWAMTVPLSYLISFHLTRFVGVAFLVLYEKGIIPGAFAVTAGWGDIAVAIGAIAVVAGVLPVTSLRRWWALLAWNVFGLVDILMVLAVGMKLGLADFEQMAWITYFPMSLVPTFVVPIVIVTHLLIFTRLFAWKRIQARDSRGRLTTFPPDSRSR